MTWQVWSAFFVIEAVLCITPGPAVLFVLSQALTRGVGKTVWSIGGILASNTTYFILSATGVGAILLASYDLFFAIKWIGAAYLVWLGVRGVSRQVQDFVDPSRRCVACIKAATVPERLCAADVESEGSDLLHRVRAAVPQPTCCNRSAGRDPCSHIGLHRVRGAVDLRDTG